MFQATNQISVQLEILLVEADFPGSWIATHNAQSVYHNHFGLFI